MTTKCIDISAWQGRVGVNVFQDNRKGIPSVILRSPYTKQNKFDMYEDKVFAQNILAAYKAGMKIGMSVGALSR